MHVHLVVHETFEAPDAFALWAQQRVYETTFSRVYEHDPLPANAEEIDLLVVMGGPQSPATTLDECPYFDAKAEQRLIRQCVDAAKAVVGVCLGSQLIGEVLGAPWMNQMTKEDLRGLTPLIYSNVNPYGLIQLNMAERLPIGQARAM